MQTNLIISRVIIRFHLLPNSAQAADVSTVLVNGKVLMENYEVKTINVDETMREGERMAFDLVSRAKES